MLNLEDSIIFYPKKREEKKKDSYIFFSKRMKLSYSILNSQLNTPVLENENNVCVLLVMVNRRLSFIRKHNILHLKMHRIYVFPFPKTL